MTTFQGCSRCGKEAFKTSLAIWYCDTCYYRIHPEEQPSQSLSDDTPNKERVVIKFVEPAYKGLYCAGCVYSQGIMQIDMDGKVCALACSERCLRKILQESREHFPLTLVQCVRYGIKYQ
jgi:hypothetical protein